MSESEIFNLINNWLETAKETEKKVNPNNRTPVFGILASINNDKPSARTIAINKMFEDNSLLFFTQKSSTKVKQLTINNNVSLVIYLPHHNRQIIFEGIVEELDDERTNYYCENYPKTAQINFLAYGPTSGQIIQSNDHLNELVASYTKQYANTKPAKPDSYIGYIIKPSLIKTYNYNTNLISDSIIYKKSASGWEKFRVTP